MDSISWSFDRDIDIITSRSKEHLGVVSSIPKLKDLICRFLKDEYDSTPAFSGGLDIEIRPADFTVRQISPDDGFSHPARVATGEPEILVSTFVRPNKRREEILETAIRLGCEWAYKESGCKKTSVTKLPLEACKEVSIQNK
ncbi:hypothetical protein PM10SUCC1_00240 [Propionigenium maris DSM 9537]|uniref:Uncharacterized protein n=1 Tax=Propionigenium maris DSM 9537 TaxID=1123000 RepID=A0A9W6GIH5_9FUSO|nr:hypothetical protein [Propionigenium maris]GLI54509.1 hypothetical protein PM10SUCC1_00240 [Propionigenium maris DSM 9537]